MLEGQRTYPEPVIQLPLDDWLYEARPVPSCQVCQAAALELEKAKKAHKAQRRFDAARTIRMHSHTEES